MPCKKFARGQLTIDFFISFIYILVIIVTLFAIKDSFIANQNEITIRAQEKRIAYELANIIASSASLSDGLARIEFRVPGIYYLYKTQPMPCDITITNNYIEIKVNAYGKEITERAFIKKPLNLSLSGNKCTQKIILHYT